jgi:hypothetical protein
MGLMHRWSGGAGSGHRSFIATQGMAPRWLLFVALGLGAVLIAACGSAPARRLGWVEADANARAQATTPFQSAILRDGKVTFAEYKQSTRAVVHCLRTAPVPIAIHGPRAAPGGELEFTWVVKAPRRDYKRADAVARRRFEHCHRKFEDDVKLVYSNQRVIPERDRPAMLASLASCLRAAGLKLPPQPPMKTLIATIDGDKRELGKACIAKYFDFFRLPAH